MITGAGGVVEPGMKGHSEEAALVIGVACDQRRLHATLEVESRCGQQVPVLDDSQQPVLLHHEQAVGIARRADGIIGGGHVGGNG